jgi:hypothetical protein
MSSIVTAAEADWLPVSAVKLPLQHRHRANGENRI